MKNHSTPVGSMSRVPRLEIYTCSQKILYQHLGSIQKYHRPVICVGDHAVSVEDTTDVLLWPVSTGSLLLQQKLRSAVQRLCISQVIFRSNEAHHCPRRIHNMRLSIQLTVYLHHQRTL